MAGSVIHDRDISNRDGAAVWILQSADIDLVSKDPSISVSMMSKSVIMSDPPPVI